MGWGVSCRDGVCHVGMGCGGSWRWGVSYRSGVGCVMGGWVMQGWGRVGHAGWGGVGHAVVGCVMQEWHGSCRGGEGCEKFH